MIDYKAYRAACAEEEQAYNEYMDLRDAKSNGCCHGYTIPQVLAYDAKIEAAARKLHLARAKISEVLAGNIEGM